MHAISLVNMIRKVNLSLKAITVSVNLGFYLQIDKNDKQSIPFLFYFIY